MKRKGIYKKIVSAFAATALAASCLLSVLSYAEGEDLSADLKQFDDKNQEQIVYDMGAGINLGNQFEAVNPDGYPGETAWGNPVITKELVKQIHDSGFNTIRLPVSYFLRIGDGPDYIIEEAWLDRIQEVVDYAYELGMYVIMNMHGDGYYTIDNSWLLLGDYDDINPRKYSTDEEYQQALEKEQARVDAMVDKYEKVWTQVAERYKDYDEHIIFESMNEMQSKQTGTTFAKMFYPVLNRLNQSFVDTIRRTGGNNAKRWLLIPGWWASLDKITNDSLGFEIPTDNYRDSSITENRLFLSIHFYEPSDFCLSETAATTKWNFESGYSNIETQFKQAYAKFTSQGYPIIIGEFGAVDKSSFDSENTACREAFYNAVSQAAKQYGLVPVVWDNGYTGDYGLALFDRSKATVKYQQIINGVMEVFNPDKVIDVPTDPTKPSDPNRKELTLADGYPTSAECGEGSSFDGYLQSILKDVYNFAEYSELEVTFTVDGDVTDDMKVFNFQPYTNSYSGWQDTFLTIGDCTLGDDGVYTGKIALTDITAHLGLADTYGINISYVQAQPNVSLKSYYIIKSDVPSPSEPTTEPPIIQLGGDIESNLYFADSDWSMQANIPVTITGDGLYTYDIVSQESDTWHGDASGAVVFVLDLYDAANTHPNLKVELVSINCAGREIEIDQSKIPALSDIEGKGNLRLEIYNEYGLTVNDPPIDFFDIELPMGSVMSVTVRVSDFDVDVMEEVPTTSEAETTEAFTASEEVTTDESTTSESTETEAIEAEPTDAQPTEADTTQELEASSEKAATETTVTTTESDPSGNANTTDKSDASEDKSGGSASSTDKPVNTGAPIAIGSSVFMIVGIAGVIAIKKRNR